MSAIRLCLLLLLSIIVVANGKSFLGLSSSTATNEFFESEAVQRLTNQCQTMLQEGREKVESENGQIVQATDTSCQKLAKRARKYLRIRSVPRGTFDRVISFGFLTKDDGTPADGTSNVNLVSVSGTRMKEKKGFCRTIPFAEAAYKSDKQNKNPGNTLMKLPVHRTCSEHKIINGNEVTSLASDDWLYLYSEFVPCEACKEEIALFAQENNIFVMWGAP
eukprot:GILK01003889.1.p1 GENE.GILK01003889.1~~GILK01003889.1.p1  ORF type:complete len:235 (+),score=30.35 GILK01003889.1:47-706(+)